MSCSRCCSNRLLSIRPAGGDSAQCGGDDERDVPLLSVAHLLSHLPVCCCLLLQTYEVPTTVQVQVESLQEEIVQEQVSFDPPRPASVKPYSASALLASFCDEVSLRDPANDVSHASLRVRKQIEVEVEQPPVQYVTKVQQVPVQQMPVQSYQTVQTLQTVPTSSYQVSSLV